MESAGTLPACWLRSPARCSSEALASRFPTCLLAGSQQREAVPSEVGSNLPWTMRPRMRRRVVTTHTHPHSIAEHTVVLSSLCQAPGKREDADVEGRVLPLQALVTQMGTHSKTQDKIGW